MKLETKQEMEMTQQRRRQLCESKRRSRSNPESRQKEWKRDRVRDRKRKKNRIRSRIPSPDGLFSGDSLPPLPLLGKQMERCAAGLDNHGARIADTMEKFGTNLVQAMHGRGDDVISVLGKYGLCLASTLDKHGNRTAKAMSKNAECIASLCTKMAGEKRKLQEGAEHMPTAKRQRAPPPSILKPPPPPPPPADLQCQKKVTLPTTPNGYEVRRIEGFDPKYNQLAFHRLCAENAELKACIAHRDSKENQDVVNLRDNLDSVYASYTKNRSEYDVLRSKYNANKTENKRLLQEKLDLQRRLDRVFQKYTNFASLQYSKTSTVPASPIKIEE
mmetsp:Transcript_14151/g.21602  ORF Transcript_14151/g.21602 Transcript_14151/m.21602 type:complete len:331 (+) Transcript_14151:434-1426(+)